MNVLKRALTSMIRQPGKSVILLILIFAIGTVLSGVISIGHAIIATDESLMMRMPAVATLTVDHHARLEKGVTWDLMEQPSVAAMSAIGNLPYVSVYDLVIETRFFSQALLWAEMDIDEERLPESESMDSISWAFRGARSRGAALEPFEGIGVSHPNITDMDAGLINLVEGRAFTQEEIDQDARVVVISQAFATTNNLGIGSMITFENIAHDYPTMGAEGSGNFELDRHDEQFILASQMLEVEVVVFLIWHSHLIMKLIQRIFNF